MTTALSLARDVLKTPGLEKATHGIEMEPKPRHFSLRFEAASFTVNIESTALKVMDSIARFSLDDQKKIIMVILSKLPEAGMSILFQEDSLGGGTAYVTRRPDSSQGVVNLLFSR